MKVMGVPRIHTDRDQSMQEQVASVERKLNNL